MAFAARQDWAGLAQFEWSTTWKEEEGSFFQVGRFVTVGGERGCLGRSTAMDGRAGSGWDVGSGGAA